MKGYCVYVNSEENEELSVGYEVHGTSEEKVEMLVSDPSKAELLRMSEVRAFTTQLKVRAKTKYSVCFRKLDSRYKKVTFDVQLSKQGGSSLANAKDLDQVHAELLRV